MANGVEASEKSQDIKLSPEQLREKIIYQVEFYFGDYNLPKDKFLQTKVKENDGWIELDTLLTFNRLKSLTTDKALISHALKASDHGIVQVSEDNLKVRRNPDKPLPAGSFKDEFIKRTVYVKGFPKDTTLDQLIEFFRPHGSGCVKMRRFMFNRQFKGSVFVLMETAEAAKKLAETKGLKFNGNSGNGNSGAEGGEAAAATSTANEDLILMMAEEHAAQKEAERKKSGGKGEKRKADGDAEGEEGAGDELKELANIEEMFQKMDKKPGVFMRLTGIPKEGSEIGFQDIKAVFVDAGFKVGFVEFEKGQEEAMIRFDGENVGKEAGEKLVKDGKLVIKEVSLDAKVLEGDEETAQYRKQAAIKAARFKEDRSNRKRAGQNRQQGYRGRGGKRRHGGGGGRDNNRRGGGGGGRGRDRGDAGGEPSEKRAKANDE